VNDTSQKLSYISQIHNFVRTKAADNQQNQPKTFQGHVSKILENDMLEFTLDATGPFTLPKLQIPQAFSSYHREPTQVGDKGYAVPSDFSIAPTDGVSGGTANMYPRGNLATHVFHPISNKNFDQRDPNMFLVTGGPSGHTIQSKDKKTSTIIDILNNIVHVSSSSIQHSAVNNIIHTAGEILSHNGKTINQIAETAMVHAVTNGTLQHLAQQIIMAQPSTRLLNVTNPPTPPSPGAQTILNVIGDIHATGNITTPNGSVGPPGGSGPPGVQGPQGPPGAPIQGTLPQIVTGAKGGNTALVSLLTCLVSMGLIVDNTTA
jgi:hypothetical protein